MIDVTLAGYALKGKRYVASRELVQLTPMSEPDLGKLFLLRLKAEMDGRQISANQLARLAKNRGHKIGQTTISLILKGKMSPTIKKLQAIAAGLDVPAWYLLTNNVHIEERIVRPFVAAQQNVTQLPNPYPPIFGVTSKLAKVSRPKRRKRV
jgi:transcriptional regulator with XRE-family HTH domain